mgnify:CR=1 FL=1
MEITLFLKFAECGAFSANGVFLENGACIKFRKCECVYVTVFPLDVCLLPYTVKFSGENVSPCGGLVRVIKLDECRYLALFEKRYSYVFSPREKCPCDCSSAGEFFSCVKKGDFPSARKYMTASLSSSVDDNSLSEFFAPYVSIVRDENFICKDKDAFLLIDDSGVAHPVTLSLKNNLVDDIVEK